MPDKYKKNKGTAGLEGVQFQLDLLTVALVNAVYSQQGWRISSENEEAGKYDDIVIELPDGSAVLIQSKHKDTKKITKQQLFSHNSKSVDFSLPKYFFSYEEIKSKFRATVIICTNTTINTKGLEDVLIPQTANPDSMLHYEGCSFYNFKDNILGDLKQSAQIYLKKNLQGKCDEKVITDENLKEFLRHLQFFSKYPSGADLHKIIERRLSLFDNSSLWCKTTYPQIYRKVEEWFKQPRGVYLTEFSATAMLCEIRSDKYCELLKDYGVSFDRNDFNCTDKHSVIVVKSEEAYLLQMLKIFHKLQQDKRKKLYVNPNDGVDVHNQVIEAFKQQQYAFLIMKWNENIKETFVKQIGKELGKILQDHQFRKVILLGCNKLSQAELKDSFLVDEIVTFQDLTKDCQKMLLERETVFFQDKATTIEKLFVMQETEVYTKSLDSKTLEKLIKGEVIKVGVEVLDLDIDTSRYYITRTFQRKIDKWEKSEHSEENIFGVNEKLVLISDSAGTGKSTVLTKLALTIKEKHPNLWVIRVNLNDYTRMLRDSQKIRDSKAKIGVTDFLDSQETTRLTQFERLVFSMDKKVVLMLDGVDEVSPNYTDLMLDLLTQCQDSSNFLKIFATTRPHMCLQLEETLGVKAFKLLPFTKQNQIDFLTRYWTYNLKSKDDTYAGKCERYAKALIDKMSTWIKSYDHQSSLAAIPLQVKLLAEIFEENIKHKELKEEGAVLLPEKFDITKLYDMFIKKKREVFIDKGNAGGNALSERAISDQFEKCLDNHRRLALESILSKTQRDLFLNCRKDDEDLNVYLLKIGIVQKSDEEYQFIHRTFAEYFVAKSILREIELENQNVEFDKFFIDELLLKREFEVIRAFIDNLLPTINLPSNIFENYLSFTYQSELKYWISTENLIFVLTSEGCVAILQLVLQSINFKVVTDKEINIKNWRLNIKNKNTLKDIEILMQESGVNIRDINGYMPLHRCVIGRHFEMAKFLLEQGANFDATDEEGNTPLILASEGCLDIVKLLLQHDAAIDTSNNDGRTALHEAAESGCLDIVKHLLEVGGDYNIKDDDGRTALQLAVQRNHLDTVKYLVGRGVDFDIRDKDGSSVLHLACARGYLDIVEYFVGLNVDINIKDNNGRTALHVASECGYLEMVEYLTGLHVDPNIKDKEGHTALHLAVIKGYLDIVKYLKKDDLDFRITDDEGRSALHLAASNGFLDVVMVVGGDVNIADKNGCTALHLAVGKGYTDIVKHLVECGADVNVKDNDGRTPLHSAALTNKLNCINYLTEHGADPNARDNIGRTALHLAAADGFLDTIKFLVQLGVDFNIKDLNGRMAFHFAALKGKISILNYLVELGVDLNIKDNDGESAIHYAVLNDKINTVKYLSQLGIDLNVKDNNSRTPLHMAALNKKLDTVKYLTQLGVNSDIKDENGNIAFDYIDIADILKYVMELDVTEQDNAKSIEHSEDLDTARDSDGELEFVLLHAVETNSGENEYIRKSDLNIANRLENELDFTSSGHAIKINNKDAKVVVNNETGPFKNLIKHSVNVNNRDNIVELNSVNGFSENMLDNNDPKILNLAIEKSDLDTAKESNINEGQLDSPERYVVYSTDINNKNIDVVPNHELDTCKNVIKHTANVNNVDNISIALYSAAEDNNNSKVPHLATKKDDLDTVNHSNINGGKMNPLAHSTVHAIDVNDRDTIPTTLNPIIEDNDSKIPNLATPENYLDTVKSSGINESKLASLELSVGYSVDINNENIAMKSNGDLNNKDTIPTAPSSAVKDNDNVIIPNLAVQNGDFNRLKHTGSMIHNNCPIPHLPVEEGDLDIANESVGNDSQKPLASGPKSMIQCPICVIA